MIRMSFMSASSWGTSLSRESWLNGPSVSQKERDSFYHRRVPYEHCDHAFKV